MKIMFAVCAPSCYTSIILFQQKFNIKIDIFQIDQFSFIHLYSEPDKKPL